MRTTCRRWLPVYLSHVLLMAVFFAATQSPLYGAPIYAPWRKVSALFLVAVIGWGWVSPRRKARDGLPMRAFPYFLSLALLFRRIRRPGVSWRWYWRHRLVRERWALLVLKAYFIPLVTSNLVVSLTAVWTIPRYAWSFPLAVLFLRYAVMMVSASIATVGYTLESRPHGAPIKAVETSLLGWLFCLSCYPPVREIPGRFIAARFFEHHRLFPRDSLPDYVCAALAAGFLALHVYTIAAQGVRFANLTYRGTVSHGPFALVRHPQYATKLAGWFFEWLPYFRYLPNIPFYLAWVGLYLGRALTEERFLSRFEDYRVYKDKVRWRFIPGVW